MHRGRHAEHASSSQQKEPAQHPTPKQHAAPCCTAQHAHLQVGQEAVEFLAGGSAREVLAAHLQQRAHEADAEEVGGRVQPPVRVWGQGQAVECWRMDGVGTAAGGGGTAWKRDTPAKRCASDACHPHLPTPNLDNSTGAPTHRVTSGGVPASWPYARMRCSVANTTWELSSL